MLYIKLFAGKYKYQICKIILQENVVTIFGHIELGLLGEITIGRYT
jgi:hypothetical protein